MRVAMVEEIGKPLRVTQVPDPTPGEGEVVIRVARCGICSSDLHMTEGHGFTFPPGAVPGHEFGGEVVAIGKGAEGVAVGDRVSVLPARTCGRCAACLAGTPFACAAGSRTIGIGPTWGGYAEYALADARWCLRMPASLSDDDAALIEPIAVGLHGIGLSGLRPGDDALVIGAGPVGLAAAYWLRQMGAGRIIVTASSRRKQMLAEAMGADLFVVPDEGETIAEAVHASIGRRADLVIECSGAPGMLDAAIASVRRNGTVTVLGICGAPEPIDTLRAVLNEVSLRFAFAFDQREFQHSIDAMARGLVEPRAMITDHVSLADVPTRFEELRTARDQCKVMIDPWR